MDCHATARGSNPGRNGVFIELHVLRKGQQMGVPSLNDLAVNGTLNTTNINTCTYRIIPVHTFGYRAGVIITTDIDKPDAEVKTLSP